MDNQTVQRSGTFIPDKRLARSDADITLYFLSSPGVISADRSRDKWFRTTVPFGDIYWPTGGTSTTYIPDVPASPLGCTQQYQFCNADQDHCGPLASLIDAMQMAAPMFGTTTNIFYQTTMTEPTIGRFQRLINTLLEYPIQFVTNDYLGSESLLAQQTLNDFFQGRLPDDQWQREMTARWATALAGLQAFFVETAAGVNYPGLEDFRGYEPLESFEKDMCTNQVSLFTSYTQKPLPFLLPLLIHILWFPENPFFISRFIFRVRPVLYLLRRHYHHNALTYPGAVPTMLPPPPSKTARGPRVRTRWNVQGRGMDRQQHPSVVTLRARERGSGAVDALCG